MINSYQSTPLEYIRKDNFPSNQANSEQSESSTGESQYKDDISNKNIKKNNEDDSDDESEDYGNADDDDFDNILKESINIRKTQHAINLKNNLSQNPFLNKSNNNTNPTKKNIENKGNNNTNNNNLNKVKQIPNQIKQNLNKKTGDINLNQELNKE